MVMVPGPVLEMVMVRGAAATPTWLLPKLMEAGEALMLPTAVAEVRKMLPWVRVPAAVW